MSHCLTLTLTVGAPHLHSKKFANKEQRARNATPKVAYHGWVWVWGDWMGPGLVWMGCDVFAVSLLWGAVS
jgi:hypothetical protein